jgi:hypothetical protein
MSSPQDHSESFERNTPPSSPSIDEALSTLEAALAPRQDAAEDAMAGLQATREASLRAEQEQAGRAETDMQLMRDFGTMVLPLARDLWRGEGRGRDLAHAWWTWRRQTPTPVIFDVDSYQKANALQSHTVWGRLPKKEWRGNPGYRERSERKIYRRGYAPFFIVGDREVDENQSEALLLMPKRQHFYTPDHSPLLWAERGVSAEDAQSQGFKDRRPALFVMETATVDLDLIKDTLEERATRYQEEAASDKTPEELDRAVNNGRWPHLSYWPPFSDDIIKIDRALLGIRRPHVIKRVKPEDLTDTYPLASFHTVEKLAELAITFGKQDGLKQILSQRS